MTMTETQKIAIITGSARGIGLATAQKMKQNAIQPVLVDYDTQALKEAKELLGDVLAVACDISRPDQIDQMIQTVISEYGQIDILVNNAGIADFGPIEETDFARWKAVMSTNLDGVFLCTQAAIPYLKQTKGAIVNIGSISGLRASTLRVAYGTSKAGVIQLTQQQAVELGEYGIRANCVCPGPVKTKLAMAVHTQDIIDSYHDAIPLNRYGNEAEIAAAIYFLASEQASYITGQTLSVDGGFEATGVGLPALRS